ncbi:hypothetical protein BDZ89DRAFT_1070471 [Hymenopellis radicata]|nr:hypothetical protein BDZ89DRAFT_1070471 [Hymenopellis radicata]
MPSALNRDSISTLTNLATSSDRNTCLKALKSLSGIVASSPDTYTHIFDVVKFWLQVQRVPSFAHGRISDTFSVQATCVYVLGMVIKQQTPSVPWMNKRFVAMTELWPVVSEWIRRLFANTVPFRPS